MKRIFVVFISLTVSVSKNIGVDSKTLLAGQTSKALVYENKKATNSGAVSERRPLLRTEVFRISGYTLHPAQTDNTPYVASCGSLVPLLRKNIRVFAVSRDLFFRNGKKWLCGRKAVLKYGNGKVERGVVFDTMNPRYKKAVDVLVHQSGYSQARLINIAYSEYGVGRTGKGVFIVY